MAQVIISRSDAVAQGLTRYFTGKPCSSGHIAERQVSNYGCLVCLAERTTAWRKRNPENVREWSRRMDRKLWTEAPEKYNERKRAQRSRNPETTRARDKRYQDANRELVRERSRSWKARNRERNLEITREWHAKNPDAGALWHKNNPEKSRENVRRRRARKLAAPGSHTAADIAALLVAQKHRCANCGADLRKVKRHLDHIQPLSRGGSEDKSNLAWLCGPCNQSKGARDPIEYAQMQGRLL